MGLPVVVLPYVNTALAARAPRSAAPSSRCGTRAFTSSSAPAGSSRTNPAAAPTPRSSRGTSP